MNAERSDDVLPPGLVAGEYVSLASVSAALG
jgi:hypothetical protein